MKYTIFSTYVLVPTGSTGNTGLYQQAIHCNYINRTDIDINNLSIYRHNIYFPDASDFKFLNTNPSAGTGYTANRIHFLVQTGYTSSNINPDPKLWKVYDATNDMEVHYSGILTPLGLTSNVFEIPMGEYSGMTNYDLTYLDYPASTQNDSLTFGSETYFLGNVSTEIKADVFTTDIDINLPLSEYNNSTNETWNGSEAVYISEIGIYDDNGELVAIGKLNNPISKDSTVSRTIKFAIDF